MSKHAGTEWTDGPWYEERDTEQPQLQCVICGDLVDAQDCACTNPVICLACDEGEWDDDE